MTTYPVLALVSVLLCLTGCIPIFVGERRPPESGAFDLNQAERSVGVPRSLPEDSVVARPICLRRSQDGFYLDLLLESGDPGRLERAGSNVWSGIAHWEREDSRPFILSNATGGTLDFEQNSEPSLFFFPIPVMSAPQVLPYPSRQIELADGRSVLIQEVGFRGTLPQGDSFAFAWSPNVKMGDRSARGVVFLDADGPLPVR